MDVPVLRKTLATFICIRLLGVVNFDYFLRHGCENPWCSLLPFLAIPVEELGMFHECLVSTEPCSLSWQSFSSCGLFVIFVFM